MTTKIQFTYLAIVIGVLMLLVLPVCAAAPTVDTTTPGRWLNGTDLNIYITGHNFPFPGSGPDYITVTLNQSPLQNVTSVGITYNSDQSISASFGQQRIHFGDWNVTVINMTDNSNGTMSNALSVYNNPPTLTQISPANWGYNNTSTFDFTLSGTNFFTTPRVNLSLLDPPNTNITATNVIFLDSTSVRGTFDLNGKPAGQYTVNLTNLDGNVSNTLPFTIYCPPPIITSVAPLSGTQGTSNYPIRIEGFNFNLTGATVELFNGSTSTYIPIDSGPARSSSLLTFTVNLATQTVGLYNVTVINHGPLYNNTTWTQPFQVFYPNVPVVTRLNQTTHVNTSNTSVLITGSVFYPGLDVWLSRSGSADIRSSSVVRVDATNITCNLTTNGTLAGPWYVKVVNNDTQSNILGASSLFTITAPPPPTANFTANVTRGSAPLSVLFTDNSITTGTTTYQWILSDGTTSTGQDLTHTFTNPGIYNVFHSVTNSSGTNWKNMTGYINATHPARIAVYTNGEWSQDFNGNHIWDGVPTDRFYTFGSAGPIPVVGAWNNTTPEIGVFLNGGWWLDNNGNFTWDNTPTDKFYTFGSTGVTPVVGDWNRNGVDKIGVFLNGGWWLDNNGNNVWDGTSGGDKFYTFGSTGVTPVVGDWNRDGFREIGVFLNGGWWVDSNNNGQWDGTSGGDSFYTFGSSGVTPVVGDWNNDGFDEIGVFLNGAWMVDYNANNVWDTGDQVYVFGSTGVNPVVIPL